MGMNKETYTQLKELSSLLPVITLVAVLIMAPSIVEYRPAASEVDVTLVVFLLLTAGVGTLFVLLERRKKLVSYPYSNLIGEDGRRS